MGSPTTEKCRGSDEAEHEVTLTHAFFLKVTEVTQAEFEAQMGYNPSHFSSCGSTCPVEMVSWPEALYYCNRLSQKEGLAECFDCSGSLPDVTCSLKGQYGSVYQCPGYRLPTEAEWEYAARAGTTTAYCSGENSSDCQCGADPNLEAIGSYCHNSGVSYSGCYYVTGGPDCAGTHPVGQKQPNDWRLYDMSGNVHEWCWDWYDNYPTGSVTDPSGSPPGSYRVLRGGSWDDLARHCRSAFRGTGSGDPGTRTHALGLRPARSAP